MQQDFDLSNRKFQYNVKIMWAKRLKKRQTFKPLAQIPPETIAALPPIVPLPVAARALKLACMTVYLWTRTHGLPCLRTEHNRILLVRTDFQDWLARTGRLETPKHRKKRLAKEKAQLAITAWPLDAIAARPGESETQAVSEVVLPPETQTEA
jgi:hypothetical protein